MLLALVPLWRFVGAVLDPMSHLLTVLVELWLPLLLGPFTFAFLEKTQLAVFLVWGWG